MHSAAHDAVDVLRSGGLVVFPTETVYGIAASAASAKGMAALRALKDRPKQPFTLHLPDPAAAERYLDGSHPMLQRLLRKVFPGPITLVVDVQPEVQHQRLLALGIDPDERDRLYVNDTIGLRCPDEPFAQRMLAAAEQPIVASSANLHGQPPATDARQAIGSLDDKVDLIIDAGRCRYSKASTVVRLRMVNGVPTHSIERVGVYDQRFIEKLLKWTVLFVCSGNTCRSPMAEAWARHEVASHRGISIDDLDTAGIRVISAGASAAPGFPASREAVQVLHAHGIDLSKHRSRMLTVEMVHEADVIYCMTRAHQQAVTNLIPAAAAKTHLLDPNSDIEDPVGAGAALYDQCSDLIHRHVVERLSEWGLS